ncbi:MAG: ABC transporter substrate-binding protein, partial [Paracoccaceae bacterium]
MRQSLAMRMLFAIVIALGFAPVAQAEVAVFAAAGEVRRLSIYSTLDTRLVAPMIGAFQARNPGISVVYEDLLAAEIAERVIAETDAGAATADFVFSAAMDLQMKLANDGYAQPVEIAADWPRWANWRDTAFALTLEPGVMVYHKPSFPDGPPQSRLALIEWLRQTPPELRGRIGTYDIEQSAVG